MSEFVLKGGISYIDYIWRSEDGACEKCQMLNGQKFTDPNEIPNKPHPNCRCWVEVSEGNNGNGEGEIDYSNSSESWEDDELCDCNEQYLDNLIFELEKGKGDAQSLAADYSKLEFKLLDSQKHFEEIIQSYKNMLQEVENEIKDHLAFCSNGLSEIWDEINKKIDELSTLIKSAVTLIEFNKTQEKVVLYFISQYVILLHEAYVLKRAGMDKYRHSVANCKGAQLGEFGEATATMLSDFKEYYDQWEDVYAKSHGVTIEEAKADSERDQVANRLGRLRGKENPTCDCRELMKDLIPKSHRNKY